MKTNLFLLLGARLVAGAVVAAEPVTLTVQVDKPGAKINPAMWGIFFEDINFGADGGLYAGLVKNPSFEFPDSMMGWSRVQRAAALGSLAVLDQDPLNLSNSHYLRIQVISAGEG